MTKLLLEKEAYINAVSKNGNTPLHLAIDEFNKGSSHIQRNLVELLIEKGADITAKNGQSQTPQNLAPESVSTALPTHMY